MYFLVIYRLYFCLHVVLKIIWIRIKPKISKGRDIFIPRKEPRGREICRPLGRRNSDLPISKEGVIARAPEEETDTWLGGAT
jgi:hypothetical protein